MSVPKRTIIYKNIECEVCEWAIDEVINFGLEFNEEYITDLLKNDRPYLPNGYQSLDLLAHYDILNRKYIGSSGLLGRIVKIDKRGIILDYFESVFDASMDALKGNYKYSFEKLHYSGAVSSKVLYDFFGITINVNLTGGEFETISSLNTVIRRNKNRYLGKRKIVREMYTNEVASRMTYDEYVIQGMRWEAFTFGFRIQNLLGTPRESQYTKHDIEKCNDYPERIHTLFQKYSVEGLSAFKKVEDLNQVKFFPGVYLLCLPQIKGCYVGTTECCFATRITQHFTKPNSAFDRNYKPSDIKEIYVLHLDETMQFIDLIEEDCIATLGKEICLNALAGGSSIELIKSDKYDATQHLLSPDLLQWVAKDSLNITQYWKACAEDST